MGRFNLIDEPWVSVMVDKTGKTQEVSLQDLFENAHLYHRIAGDTATQDFAVLRVLLAVLHTVFSRLDAKGQPYGYFDLDDRLKPLSSIEDEDDLDDYTDALKQTWKDLWQMGLFPKIVTTYLQKWHDRFYLLDESYPFFQVVAADVATENITRNQPTPVLGKTINRLVSESGKEISSEKENKVALFSPKTDDNKSILSPSECARWLLTFQGYCDGAH
jgi:CRISPR system Cascade subunit CasA